MYYSTTKFNPGNTSSSCFLTIQGFNKFRNQEISTGESAIREQLANLDGGKRFYNGRFIVSPLMKGQVDTVGTAIRELFLKK